jgi:hypothetical protein
MLSADFLPGRMRIAFGTGVCCNLVINRHVAIVNVLQREARARRVKVLLRDSPMRLPRRACRAIDLAPAFQADAIVISMH